MERFQDSIHQANSETVPEMCSKIASFLRREKVTSNLITTEMNIDHSWVSIMLGPLAFWKPNLWLNRFLWWVIDDLKPPLVHEGRRENVPRNIFLEVRLALPKKLSDHIMTHPCFGHCYIYMHMCISGCLYIYMFRMMNLSPESSWAMHFSMVLWRLDDSIWGKPPSSFAAWMVSPAAATFPRRESWKKEVIQDV